MANTFYNLVLINLPNDRRCRRGERTSTDDANPLSVDPPKKNGREMVDALDAAALIPQPQQEDTKTQEKPFWPPAPAISEARTEFSTLGS